MESRLAGALQRIAEADAAMRDSGNDPEIFVLVYRGGGTREVLHPRWNKSWATPTAEDVDDLESLGYLRLEPPGNAKRKFFPTPRGRTEGKALSPALREVPQPGRAPPDDIILRWLVQLRHDAPETLESPSRLLDRAMTDALIDNLGREPLAEALVGLVAQQYLEGFVPDWDQATALQRLGRAEELKLTMKAHEYINRAEGATTPDREHPPPARTPGTPVDQLEASPAPGEQAAKGDARKVMVVHGRDAEARNGMFSFLRCLGLLPQEWGELVKATGEGAPYIGQVLDQALDIVRAVVVLFTPEDEVRLHPDLQSDTESSGEREWSMQPRPNVLYEAGLAFGRHPDRTLLVELGSSRAVTDLLGRHTVRLDGTVGPLRDLAARLQSAGCEVNDAGNDWLNPSLFPRPTRSPTRAERSGEPAVAPAEPTSPSPGGPDGPAGPDEPVLRILREVLEGALASPAPDLPQALLTTLRDQEEPFRFEDIAQRLPGRILDAEAQNRLRFDLEENGVLQASAGPGRGYARGPRLHQ